MNNEVNNNPFVFNSRNQLAKSFSNNNYQNKFLLS